MLLSGTIFNRAYLFKKTSGKIQTEYTADETGNRIANIPYDKYILPVNVPTDAYLCDVDENNSADLNTSIIQKQIDAANENGGGVVVIPKGRYKVSTIILKSNVTLFVSNGAELVSVTPEENEKCSDKITSAVVFAEDEVNIAVTGGGIINGAGESYTYEPEIEEPFYALERFNLYTRVIGSRKRLRKGKPIPRPSVIHFKNCTDVDVHNVILKDSAAWTFHLENCKNVSVYDFIIDNHMHVANTDGIDISGGENIKINRCFIATGDDGVVLKAVNNPINNVEIKNCIVSSYANCFKIGTETKCDVSDVRVSDCRFFMPDGISGGYSGIAIETADGSNISDISVSDIEMDGISAAFLVWAGNRMKFGEMPVGKIKNISVENIRADNVELPCAINGLKGKNGEIHITDVKINNINIRYRDTKESLSVLKKVPEFSFRDYPEITRVSHYYYHSHEMSKYWDLPCYGLFIRNADNLTLSNFNCVPRSVNKREKIIRI